MRGVLRKISGTDTLGKDSSSKERWEKAGNGGTETPREVRRPGRLLTVRTVRIKKKKAIQKRTCPAKTKNTKTVGKGNSGKKRVCNTTGCCQDRLSGKRGGGGGWVVGLGGRGFGVGGVGGGGRWGGGFGVGGGFVGGWVVGGFVCLP